MKNIFLVIAAASLMACGKSGAAKEAQEICDCYKKAMTIPENDANRQPEYSKCLDKQRTAGEKYMKDPEELRQFNEVLTPCLIEILKE